MRVPTAFLVLALASCATAAKNEPVKAPVAEVLPFVHDDYPKALAAAKRQNKPLFVDAWATWCHSCQSLRTYVLTDPSLASLADDFVWLSVDTEKDVNAGFVEKHPHSALPTLWIIDPTTERPILKWTGSANAGELKALLGASAGAKGDPSTLVATEAFVRGNRALAAGEPDVAEKEWRAGIAAAPRTHPHRARMVEALIGELAAKRFDDCASLAVKEVDALPPSTSRASIFVYGLGCARSAKRAADVAHLAELALRDARSSHLLPDDRAALYEELFASKKESDPAAAHAIAVEWTTFLDKEAEGARTSDARASLDPNRLGAYLALGEPGRAIPMLERSERDFPDDYNPPARLGRVYLELRQLDAADKAADRAIARVYGPRSMRVLGLKADVAKARGDRAGEIAALEAAVARSDRAVLTEGQKPAREALIKRLAALR